jgi:hypothetical protein
MAAQAVMPVKEEEAATARQWLQARAAPAAMAVIAAPAALATRAELPLKTPVLYRTYQQPVMLLLQQELLVMPVPAARAVQAEAV